jgi:polyhydroxyalkanoate synthesis repressor PhaR
MGTDKRPQAPRAIRRYGNRKLYDAEARRYVTLDELAQLVARGHDIQVLDQKSGDDLTNPTLAQILLEQVKGGAGRIPRQVLTRVIRLAAGPGSTWSHWPEPQDAAGRARQEAEKIVSRLLGHGRLSLDDAVALRQDLGQMVHRLVAEAQSGVEGRLRALVEHGESVAGKSLEAIRGRLEAFESYLEPPAPAATPVRKAPATRRAAGQRTGASHRRRT